MSKSCMGCMELYGDKFDICPHCGSAAETYAKNNNIKYELIG